LQARVTSSPSELQDSIFVFMADVLIFGPHPDDAEFGMGASMVKFVRSGESVSICVLCRGEAGTFGNATQREAEMKTAAEKLGANLEILAFRDCQIADTYEARIELAGIIRKHRPRIVFAPYHTNPGSPKDGTAHPDHMATGNMVRAAVRFSRIGGIAELAGEPWNVYQLLYYMVPLSVSPSIVNDVTPYMEEWETIARSHESQMKIQGGVIMQLLKTIRMAYGTMKGGGFAEAFLVDGPLQLDLVELAKAPKKN
jgi:N-acetylglucosamine malate deacetylase 1